MMTFITYEEYILFIFLLWIFNFIMPQTDKFPVTLM